MLMNVINLRMKLFMMGSPETEAKRDSDESPQHQVTVPAMFGNGVWMIR
jgi:formylglycine-generating enzyme required for sulfatase activity